MTIPRGTYASSTPSRVTHFRRIHHHQHNAALPRLLNYYCCHIRVARTDGWSIPFPTVEFVDSHPLKTITVRGRRATIRHRVNALIKGLPCQWKHTRRWFDSFWYESRNMFPHFQWFSDWELVNAEERRVNKLSWGHQLNRTGTGWSQVRALICNCSEIQIPTHDRLTGRKS